MTSVRSFVNSYALCYDEEGSVVVCPRNISSGTLMDFTVPGKESVFDCSYDTVDVVYGVMEYVTLYKPNDLRFPHNYLRVDEFHLFVQWFIYDNELDCTADEVTNETFRMFDFMRPCTTGVWKYCIRGISLNRHFYVGQGNLIYVNVLK
jgi:hypothetical protein